MERRTIITIVLLVTSGMLFLMAYNQNRDEDKSEDKGADVTAKASADAYVGTTSAGAQIEVPGGAEFGFDAKVSTVGGGLASIRLRERQYTQQGKSEDTPDYVPTERLEGPYEIVGTWSDRYYPFGLTVTSLKTKGQAAGSSMSRLIRAETDFKRTGAREVELGAPLEGDLAIAPGDIIVPMGGGAELEVASLVDDTTVRTTTDVPQNIKPRGTMVRRASPESQYRTDATYTPVSGEDGSVSLVWPNPARDRSDVWIQRTWSVAKAYRLSHKTQVVNLGAAPLEVHYQVDVHGWVDPWAEEPGMFTPPVKFWSPSCYVDDELEENTLSDLLEEDGQRESFAGPVKWFGVNSQYFLLAGVLEGDNGLQGDCSTSAEGNGVITSSFGLATTEVLPGAGATCLPEWFPGDAVRKGVRCTEAMSKLGVDAKHLDEASLDIALDNYQGDKAEAIRYRKMLLAYGASKELGTLRFTVFAGPKELGLLEDTSPALDATLDFWFVGFIAKPLLALLKVMYGWFGIWWVTILVLTVLIKGLMLPLTQKSYEQMQRMQQLRPEMETIQKKYANDKARQQQEMMNLYKRHKMNPLGGCLPMLLQMPVYIALYRCIYSAVDLYQAPLFGWVADMTQPDPYFILPILLGAFMLVQQLFMPTSPGADPMQQRIMKYAMPIMFSVFMLMLPAGLVFYIAVSTVIGIAQQYYIKKKFEVATPRRVNA